MNIKAHAIYIIALIAIALFSYANCSTCPECPEIVKTVPIKQVAPKEIVAVTPEITPKQVTKRKLPAVTEKVPCDTIKDHHFAVNFYSEIYRDSAMEITVKDTISENSIKFRSISYLRLLPDKIVHVVVPKKQTGRLYWGLQAGAGIGGFNDLGVNLMYIGKRDQAIFVHYNALDINNSNFMIGVYLPVRFSLFTRK